jgi:capsular exopolysaccharide synthesis family protein
VWNWISLPSLALVPAVRERARFGYRNGGATLPASNLLSASVTPSHDRHAPKVFWAQSVTAEAESIRGLRVVLEYCTHGASSRVFLISSPSPGEGKTTVAVNLACVLASQGKTCLIEADLRHPMIDKTLAVPSGSGLGEVLSGQAPLEDAIRSFPGVAGLSILPAKPSAVSASDLIASDAMRSVLKSMRENFENIVIDSPSVIPFSDARSLASLVDAVLLVGRYGRTTRRAITRGFQMLADVQAPVIGVVLNDVDFSSADHRYFNSGYRGSMNGGTHYPPQNMPPIPDGAAGKPADKARGAHA